MIKVLFAASECVPFIKTGGLADVIGSLPQYFNKRKYDVRVVLPKYTFYKPEITAKMQYLTHFYMPFCNQDQYVGLFSIKQNGVTYYFIDNEHYFGGNWPYTDPRFDIEKFAFFSKSLLASLHLLDFQPDILHCHDWQSALVPVYLNDCFQGDVFYHQMKTIMTIHNLKFQGMYDVDTVRNSTDLSDYYFTSDKLELDHEASLLKGGLVYADRITTVSETYAKEIQSPFFGERLDGLLTAKNHHLSGIVNGIDTKLYDPEKDKAIPFQYGIDNALEMKTKNKAALQEKLGLPVDPDAMMIGMVSRLTGQKGFDLIEYAMPELLKEHVQIVLLGSGETHFEDLFKSYAQQYPNQVSSNIFYSEALSHEIYAASDIFLMPSLFEPCGLSQLMALRYGTLPLVRETGGLKDTVVAYNRYTNEGTGYSFTNYNADEMLMVIRYALETYTKYRTRFDQMRIRAMQQDFSWKSSAKKYQALYDELAAEKT